MGLSKVWMFQMTKWPWSVIPWVAFANKTIYEMVARAAPTFSSALVELESGRWIINVKNISIPEILLY